jgi:uncharacterized protein YndB with AHSA1/START domain
VKVRSEIEIDAPRERVLETIMDTERLGEWVDAHRQVIDAPEGELEKGSTFRQKLRVAGLSFKVSWEVTRLEPPRLVEWQGAGPGGSDARVCYQLENGDGGATRFIYVNEFHLPGGKLAAAAGKKIGEERGRAEAEKTLRNLKKLLEAE